MGYYFDFVFPEDEEYDRDNLIDRFCRTGAQRPYSRPLAYLFYRAGIIYLNSKYSYAFKRGYCATFRLGRVMDVVKLTSVLRDAMELAGQPNRFQLSCVYSTKAELNMAARRVYVRLTLETSGQDRKYEHKSYIKITADVSK